MSACQSTIVHCSSIHASNRTSTHIHREPHGMYSASLQDRLTWSSGYRLVTLWYCIFHTDGTQVGHRYADKSAAVTVWWLCRIQSRSNSAEDKCTPASLTFASDLPTLSLCHNLSSVETRDPPARLLFASGSAQRVDAVLQQY